MKRLVCVSLMVLYLAICLCGCSNNVSQNIPFTDLDWDSTINTAIEYHGKEASNSYDANIGKKAYVFENVEYNGDEGNITYFFTEDEKLTAVYFDVYVDSDAEVDELYGKYIGLYEKECGDSDYSLDEGSVCGKVWYEKNANIGVMHCKFLKKFVRIQYVNPEYAEK